MSDELPVITSIDDLPETAIEELTCGNEPEVVAEKSDKNAASNAKKVEGPVAEDALITEASVEDEKIKTVDAEVVKPKRKRRTKAEMEAARAAEAEAKK